VSQRCQGADGLNFFHCSTIMEISN
jgi:hypothetical protein